MAEFVRLTCPSCGAGLKITNDVSRFACAYCGTEQVVHRGDGIVSLAPVVESLKKVEAAVDRTASELAIVRLREEISHLESRRQAVVQTKPALPSAASPWGWVLIVVGVLSVIAGLANLSRPSSTDSPATGVIFGAIFVVGGLGLFYTHRGDRTCARRRIESLDEEARRLREQIELKRDELAQHEELVSLSKTEMASPER